MKVFTIKEVIPLTLIAAMFIVGIIIFLAPCVPDNLPMHWNFKGQVDSYGSKFLAAFFGPSLTLWLYILMLLLPFLDPLKKNYHYFERAYYLVRLVLIAFLALLYCISLFVGFNLGVNISHLIIPLIGLLFVTFGAMLPQIKQNYFFGVRTPWTLHSEEVWKKTHEFAGIIFVIIGILISAAILAGDWAFIFFMFVVLSGSTLVVGYSYWIYKKIGLFDREQRKDN